MVLLWCRVVQARHARVLAAAAARVGRPAGSAVYWSDNLHGQTSRKHRDSSSSVEHVPCADEFGRSLELFQRKQLLLIVLPLLRDLHHQLYGHRNQLMPGFVT